MKILVYIQNQKINNQKAKKQNMGGMKKVIGKVEIKFNLKTS